MEHFKVGDYITIYNPFKKDLATATVAKIIRVVDYETSQGIIWYCCVTSNARLLWASTESRNLNYATEDQIMMYLLES